MIFNHTVVNFKSHIIFNHVAYTFEISRYPIYCKLDDKLILALSNQHFEYTSFSITTHDKCFQKLVILTNRRIGYSTPNLIQYSAICPDRSFAPSGSILLAGELVVQYVLIKVLSEVQIWYVRYFTFDNKVMVCYTQLLA